MSQINVDTIKKADGTGSLAIPAESGTVVTTASPSLGRRNVLENGAMTIAQRATTTTGTTSNGFHTVDRWYHGTNSFGTWTSERSTDAPDGFANSLKLTCTSAGGLGASSYVRMLIGLEGQNLQQFAFGTSSAKSMTVSFWIKSNKTGSINAWLRNTDNARAAGELVTINSADTWEYKTVTLNGDTSSGFDNDNQISAQLQFWFHGGSTWSGDAISNSFQPLTNAMHYSNATLDLGETTNDYVAITGVQLEVGSVASSYEHRSFGEDLALCQRYLEILSGADSTYDYFMNGTWNGAGEAYGMFTYQVEKRATPTISTSSASDFDVVAENVAWRTATSISFANSSPRSTQCGITVASGGDSRGFGARIRINQSSGYVHIDAEL